MFQSKSLEKGVTAADLKGLNRGQLVGVYNELTGKSIKAFKDLPTAVLRTTEAYQQWAKDHPDQVKPAPAPKAPKQPREKGPRKVKSLDFNYPVGSDECPEIRPPREGSSRAKVVELLKKGTTLEEVMKETGWTRAQAVPGIRLVHHKCGYGIRTQKSDGKLKLVQTAGEE